MPARNVQQKNCQRIFISDSFLHKNDNVNCHEIARQSDQFLLEMQSMEPHKYINKEQRFVFFGLANGLVI